VKRLFVGAVVGIAVAALVFIAVLYVADLRIESDDDPSAATALGPTVPDLVGADLSDAQAEVEALGLEVRVEGRVGGGAWWETFGQEPVVNDQTPNGSTEVPQDATVTLEVGSQ
jgi:hypothetical protein